jgi:acyl carrier protein
VTSPDAYIVTAVDVEKWLQQHIAGLFGLSPDTVSTAADFESFGIDSVQGVDMLVALENWLAMPDDIPMELLFEAPSIADAARSVAERKQQVSRS